MDNEAERLRALIHEAMPALELVSRILESARPLVLGMETLADAVKALREAA